MERKYVRIAADLENRFPQMLFQGISRLPSEQELCRTYSCSRETIRATLSLLQEKNLIIKQKGSGSFIASGRARTIAVLLPNTKEYIFPGILRRIRHFFEEYHYEVHPYETMDSVVREHEILEKLLEDPPSGILMTAAGSLLPCISTDLLNKLDAQGVPIVYLSSGYPVPETAVTIKADYRQGAYKLTEQLVRSGVRTLLGCFLQNHPASADLFTGCARYCCNHGISFSEAGTIWLSAADYRQLQQGDDARLKNFLEAYAAPGCGIVCANDETAYHVVRLLSGLGYRIPEDISVAGFDNSYFVSHGDLTLSSVGVSGKAPETLAARALLLRMTGRPASSQLLPMEYHVRKTSRAV